MNVEINKDNYEEIKEKIIDYEMNVFFEDRSKKSLDLVVSEIKKYIVGGYYKNQEIKDIKLTKYIYFDYRLRNKKPDLFQERPIMMPIEVLIKTKSGSFKIDMVNFDIVKRSLNRFFNNNCFENNLNKINIIDKEIKRDIVKILNESTLSKNINHYNFHTNHILDSLINEIQETNRVKYKNELEMCIAEYLIEPIDENYKRANYLMAKYVKEHFFTKLKHNEFNQVLNYKKYYSNSAMDYIYYNYFRRLKIDRGLELLREETMYRIRMGYDVDEYGIELMDIIGKLKGSDRFMEKVEDDISKLGFK